MNPYSASGFRQKFLTFLFAGSLAVNLAFWIACQKGWLLSRDWTMKYGITEWLINYQGGFVRRGLPGEFIFQFARNTGLDVGSTVLAISLILYGAYVLLMIRTSLSVFPTWALCAAPLIGYPAYAGDILRKDVLLLLLLFLILHISARSRITIGRQLLLGLISSLAILSHELFLFFGLPACILVDAMGSPGGPGGTRFFSQLSLRLVSWLPPVVTAIFVIDSSGTKTQAKKILDSWHELNPPPNTSREALPGALSWIEKSPQDAAAATHKLLSTIHLGLPHWALVIMAVALAFLAITLLFTQRGLGGVFVFYFAIQLCCMAPIFISALDQGRWIFLTFNSAFILTTTHPRKNLNSIIQSWQCQFNRACTFIPQAFCVIALAAWGFPHYEWSVKGWIMGTPLLSAPIRAHSYLHQQNILPSKLSKNVIAPACD